MKTSALKTVPAALSAAFLLAALPASAVAVNVSSNDGSGNQYVNTWISQGANMTGRLKSTYGNPVYYSGYTEFSGYPDDVVGRYSLNVSNTSYTSAGGTLGDNGSGPEVHGVKARVCRSRANLPDPCGSWSSEIFRY